MVGYVHVCPCISYIIKQNGNKVLSVCFAKDNILISITALSLITFKMMMVHGKVVFAYTNRVLKTKWNKQNHFPSHYLVISPDHRPVLH